MAGHDATHPGRAGRDPALAWLGATADSVQTLAEIWATVELERALADLGQAEPGGGGPWPGFDNAVHEDPLLGARVALVAAGTDRARVALAEPLTEGRLAATLARHGEGPAGRYVESSIGLDELRALAAAAGVTLSRAENGPFGASVLVVGPSAAGPHLILVEPRRARAVPAAVPSRP